MRKQLLLSVILASAAASAMAQDYFDGAFYLATYNEQTSEYQFLSRGAAWGTEATVDNYGLPLTWNKDSKVLSFAEWANTRVFSDDGSSVYTDGSLTGKSSTFDFVRIEKENDEECYLVKELKTGKFLAYSDGSFGPYVHLVDSVEAASFLPVKSGQRNFLFEILSKTSVNNLGKQLGLSISSPEELEELLANNYAVSDLSSMIDPSGFKFSAWRSGSRANTTAVEVFQGTGVLNQTITDLKPGLYKVTFHGFERNGYNADMVAQGDSGYQNVTTYLSANTYKVQFPSWYSDRAGDANPNGISEAQSLFNAGKYEASVYTYVGEDGKLDLNVTIPSYKSGHWVMFNNWGLKYYTAGVSDEDAQAAIEKATSLMSEKQEKALEAQLHDALEAFKEEGSLANYNALQEAITASEPSINAYKSAIVAIEHMKEFVQAEQAVTAEALETYKNTINVLNDKYGYGELTTAEALSIEDPTAIHGWHTAGLALDEYLCSAWDTEPNYNESSYYINTWSVEGTTDGSEFVVPFFEYWQSSGSLPAKTMTATVPVEDSKYMYEVSMWVRAKQGGDNAVDQSAITLTSGEQSVDFDGADETTVSGYAFKHLTVLAAPNDEGNIVFSLNIADDSQCSWLSWKNVQITKTSTPTGVKAIEGVSSTSNGAVYNLAGQKLNGMQKGLNIQNGKKVMVK